MINDGTTFHGSDQVAAVETDDWVPIGADLDQQPGFRKEKTDANRHSPSQEEIDAEIVAAYCDMEDGNENVVRLPFLDNPFMHGRAKSNASIGGGAAEKVEKGDYGIEDASVADFLIKPPAPRRWLLEDFLPANIAGAIAAPGATGKSFLTIQLGIAVAAGKPFFGIPVSEPGGVFIVNAEDDREEMGRRFHAIVEHMRRYDELTPSDESKLRDRLFLKDVVGWDNRVMSITKNGVDLTDVGDRIAEAAKKIPDIRLIILDAASRFRGGEENDNDHQTRFVEVMERIRKATGATVIAVHHMNKEGVRAGTSKLSMDMMRGGQGFIDGLRWGAAMACMGKDEAKKFENIDEEDARDYVRVDLVKGNYGPGWQGMWLRREDGGVLARAYIEPIDNAKKRGEADYSVVLPMIVQEIAIAEETGNPLTKRKLRDLAVKDKRFGVGKGRMEGMVARAIDEKFIRIIGKDPVSRGELLGVGRKRPHQQ